MKAKPAKTAMPTATPKLRFPKFRKTGAWEVKKLGEVIFSESSTLSFRKLTCINSGFPVYGASGLVGFISSFQQDEDYIAIIKDGSNVGSLFLYKKQSSILSTLSYLKTRDNHAYPLGWVYYLLQTLNLTKYIKGSGIPHIYYKDYADEPVITTNPEEQQKIADCLSSVDELLTAQTQKIAALQEHKKGLMQQLFPLAGKTLPTLRFPKFRKAGAWEVKPLKDLCKGIVSGGTPSTSNQLYWNGSIQWLTPAEMGKSTVRFIHSTKRNLTVEGLKNCSSELLPSCSVIISTRAPIGLVSINSNEMAINQGCKGMIPLHNTDSNFLYYYMKISTTTLNNLGAGNTFKEISATELKKFPLIVPKFPEQQKVADCLSSVDETITAQTQKIAALQEHKKGLMQQLFPSPMEVMQ